MQEVIEMTKVIEGYRLSPEQEHLWRLMQGDDEGTYRAQGAIVIEGLLDREILADAIHQLVDRHESLRTSFHRPAGVKSPLQIVSTNAEPVCRFLEISETHSLDDLVDDLFQKERDQSVDLSHDLPLQLLLVAISSHKHLLIVTLPALSADGATLENLARELSYCYARGGADLEEVAQYPQFSEWRNELLEGDDSHTGRDYWLDQNWAALSALKNPLEQDSERSIEFKTAAHKFTINEQTTARIRAVTGELRTFLLTCWHTFLWRLTEQPETTVGILHHGRSFSDLVGLFGLCDKWLPVSCKFHQNAIFSDLLSQVRRKVNEAAEWPEYFTWEDHRWAPTEDELFIPFCFELQEKPAPHEAEGLRFLLARKAICFDRFKLKLTCVPEGEILRLELVYDTQIYRAEVIEHIASCFAALVESAAAFPESRADELSWLSVSDQRKIEFDWNRTSKQYPQTESLHSLFEAQAARTPDATAIKFENHELTYDELNLRANSVAGYLQRRQIGPGSLVCLYLERSLEMVIAILGVLKAGAAYVPIDPAYPTDRVSFMLSDTGAEMVLTQSHLRSDLPLCSATVWCLDTEHLGETAENSITGVSSEHLAYVIYTSGSTGKPKGVMIPHRAIVNHMFWLQDKFPLTAADTLLQKTPFSFDASVWELFAAFLVGGKLVIARPGGHQDSAYLVKTILEEEVTTLQVVPSLLQVLLEEPALEECTSLKRVFCGGEALSGKLQQRFSERVTGELINLYGPTEAAINASCWRCCPRDNDRRVPIGRPGDNMQIYILDRHLRHVPVGTHGDLYIGGRGLSHGYLNRPDLTSEKFIPNPFAGEPGSRLYKTGDIARYQYNGVIEFLNRRDHQVKIRGYRIELGEIEAALQGCPSVRECIVEAQETEPGEKRLVAYVVPRQRPWPSAEELRTFLDSQLPHYMVPASFVLLEAMPLLPNGKLDRSALGALAEESDCRFVAPRTPIEEMLSGIWQEVLSVDQVSIHDNFFELGGHSLIATQLISRVNEVFTVEIPLRTLFESPTVAALSVEIERTWAEGKGLTAPPIEPRTHHDRLPLSFAQQRLWFLDQLEPGTAFYNIPAGLRLKGKLNVAALERALNEIVRRHEALRTAFPNIDGRPVQVILPAMHVPLPVLDLTNLSESELEVERHRLLTEEARIKFVLSEGPMLRVQLIREREEDHVLLVTMHHIVSDGWSVGVMVRELVSLYGAYAAGRESELEELTVQYGDYAEWQRHWLAGEVLEQQLGYWREQLAGMAVLELPTDYGRPAVQRYRGTHLYITLPVELEKLKAQSQRLGVTLYMSLLAAFAVVLSRYSGQTDIAVGTAIAARNRAETEKLIGLFVNTLVMRLDLAGAPSFVELLGRVREVCLGAYGHQDVPFEKLVEELQAERDLSRSPLYQVMFILQNTPGERLELPGLQVSMVGGETGTAKLDLVLSVMEGATGLQTHWEYNTDLFAEETIRRLAEHYGRVVAAMVAAEEQLVSEVQLLSEAEAAQLARWNGTVRECEGGSVVELFEEQVRARGEAVAVEEAGGARVSYRELNERANQLAEYLRGEGVKSEEVVGLCVERSLAMVVGMLGIWKAGGAYLPLEWQYPAARKELMVREAGVRVLLTEEKLLAAAPEVEKVFCLDRDEWQLKEKSVANPAPAAGGDNLAYVIYTSGSSGLPKGVLVSHRNLLSTLQASRENFNLRHTDVMAVITQISFDILLFELFLPLLSGATVLLIPTFRVLNLPQLLLDLERVTIWHSVPSLMRQLVNFLEQSGKAERLSGLRKIFIGGDSVPGDLLARMQRVFRNAEINVLYGPTEATIICISHRVEATTARQIIGTPLPNARICICDAHGNLVPVGVRGEIYIGGAGVSRGYLNRELTAEKFVPMNGGRYYRSGDVGRYLSNGKIEFLGRVDNQVKIRGYRIELSEVETALNNHPSLLDSVVVTRTARSGEQQLVGYVVVRPGCEPQVGELRNYLKEKLPDYMVPSAIVLLEQLPLTPHGKIDRKALPEPEQIKTEQTNSVLPRNQVEETLASVWKEVLGLDQIGVDENFFELGGDSILSIQIVARANQLGLSITPRLIFQHQTIAELAEVANTGPRVEAEQNIVSGFVPLTPIQHRFFAQDLNFPAHFNQALLLRVRGHLAPASLRRAIRLLITHHDALRLRFVSSEERGWQQFHSPVDEEVPVTIVDLSSLSQERQGSTIEAAAAAAQRSLNLQRGPLLRVVYFNLGPAQPARLLLVIHHLVVDGVSWRILLQDLEQIIGQIESGVEVVLPAKTTSFKQWATTLELAVREARDHHEYWQGEQWQQARQFHDPSVNTVATEESVHVGLTEAETRQLLQEVPHAYNTQINDVLITALAKTLCRWSGSSSIILTVEGHGREDRIESVDTTRTVGWFTSIYPALLQVNQELGAGELLKQIKEQLRLASQHGWWYDALRYLSPDQQIRDQLESLPPSLAGFNYLGQMDQVLDGRFDVAPESCGPTQDRSEQRAHPFEIIGAIIDGRLQMTWRHSTALHPRAIIEEVAASFIDELRQLIEHCANAQTRGFTPSDFPLAHLNQAELDRVIEGAQGEIEDIYVLSPMQQGMFFHALLEPEGGAYVNLLSWCVEGDFDVEAFAAAWQSVVDRHTILRTGFFWEDLEQPVQVVRRGVQVQVERFDWSELSQSEQVQRLKDYRRSEQARGFKLQEGLLMRVAVMRVAERSWQVVWTHHHLLTDGWSLSLVLKEVFDAYEAKINGREPGKQKRPAYREYIAWLAKQDLKAAEEYWRKQLAGFSAPTELVTNLVQKRGERRYQELRRQLSEEASEQLRSFARQQQLTTNTVVQGAWALLLSRYSGADDVVFGATVAGRPGELKQVEEMVGLFINTLAVRVRIAEQAEVGSWLRQLQAEQMEMRQYEYSPLVQVQGWSEIERGTPMFETLMVFENYPVDGSLKERSGGSRQLNISEVQSAEHTNYPLTVVAVPGSRMELRLSYDNYRFDETTIGRMMVHLQNILEAIVGDPEQVLGQLPMLSECEREQVVEWNDTGKEYECETCLHELFAAQVARTPAAVAVSCEGEQLSYQELNERANQVGHYLQAMGVGPESLVAICMNRSLDMIVGILGILKAGGAYVPVDPQYPVERQAWMLEDAGVGLVLTQSRLLEQLPAHGVQTVALDGEWEAISRESKENPNSGTVGRNLAYVIYTSGSSGQPKGVAIEHQGVCNLAAAQSEAFAVGSGSRVLQFASLSFDAAVSEIFVTLSSGGTLCVAPAGELLVGEGLQRVLREQQISAVTLPPTVLRGLEGEAELAALQTVVVAGEQSESGTLQRWLSGGRRVLNAYGPTESSVCATMWVARQEELERGKPRLGRALSNVQVYVLDREMRVVPVGVRGEIYIGGAGVGRGYLQQAGLTAGAFVPDPFSGVAGARLYRSGDLGRYLASGELEYLGRADQQVKVRGYRIELEEIEARLKQHEGVADCAVVSAGDSGEQRLVCYVVSSEESGVGSLSAGELRGWLQERLPSYMIPGEYRWVRELALTRNGKVDRERLRELQGERVRVESEHAGPRTPVEELLVGVWQEVLGLKEIGIHDNFFELGGHSLLATRVSSRMRQRLRMELPVRILFERPTISAVAEWLEESERRAAGIASPEIKRRQSGAELPLSFAQQRLWFLDQLEPGSAFYNIPAAVQLSGQLDREALKRALNEIVRRHEVLRTTFASEGGVAKQIVAAEMELELEVVDLRELEGAEQEREKARLAKEEAQRPFELSVGPLLRVKLLQLGETEQVVLLTMHHIVSDGWSMAVLIGEVAALYEAYREGRESPLPELAIQYGDFAVWQRGWLQGEVLEQQLSYWRRQLAELPVLELPTDRARPAVQSYRGAHHSFLLAPELAAGLKELSQQEGVTLYMTLLAAFQVLLSRYTGQDDVAVGSVIAGRNRSETENLIGLFLNTLVLRTDLSGAPSFVELLGRVREVCLGAYAHQDVPFEKLVEELQPERDSNRSPIVQVTFGLQNAPGEDLRLKGLSFRNVEFEMDVVRFDLTLWMTETPEGLAGYLTYSTKLFDEARIRRMENHFRKLLESIVAGPTKRLADLEIFTDSEKAEQIAVEREYEEAALQSLISTRRRTVVLSQ